MEAELREYVKGLEYEKASTLAKKIIQEQEEPSVYAQFIEGWAAYRLTNYEEAIDCISPLIQKNTSNRSYYVIRANSYLKLEKLEEARTDFESAIALKPDDHSSYKKLLNVKTKLGIDTFGTDNKIQVQHNLQVSYQARNWEQFDVLLAAMEEFDAISYRYWQLLKSLFFVEIQDPSNEWETLHDLCVEHSHELSFPVFKNFIQALISASNLERLFTELPLFKEKYNTHYPVTNLSGICALFFKHQKFEEGLAFLNDLQSQIKSKDVSARFELKAFPYFLLFRNEVDNTAHSNGISEKLMHKMLSLYPERSASLVVSKTSQDCWATIKDATSDLYLDIRYKSAQSEALQHKVLTTIKEKKPLLLLRIGDGECYAFVKEVAPEKAEEINSTLESFWWGKVLNEELRNSIIGDFISTFSSADIVGLPYAIRLSQVLTAKGEENLTYSDNRLNIVFSGVKNVLQKTKSLDGAWWTDEYCNYALMGSDFMNQVIDIAPNVIVVTCFKIPEESIFDHPKVSSIYIPPVRRVSTLKETTSNEKILPETIKDLTEELCKDIEPGTVVLVSAGFAGKFLLKAAKDHGAVAIDFGSSIDHLLGLKTRNLELHTLYSED